MATGLLRGLTFSNVSSFLALVIALGTGTAYAASTVGSSDIINKSIRSVDIKNGQVKSTDIRDATIKAPDLAPGAVTGANVLDESLTSADLATSSVGAAEIANDSVASGEILDNSITSSEILNNSITTADIAGADVNGAGISVPTGFVPNGRCRQLDAAVVGAKAGEAVIFNVKDAVQDGVVIYGQRVPTDGQVMFDVCNFSGGTQAAISDLPVRVITFG
jgi:hypothetical protein